MRSQGYLVLALVLVVGGAGCKSPLASKTGYIEISADPMSKAVIESAILDLEKASGEEFLHDPSSEYHLTIRFEKLREGELGLTMYGDDENCPILLDVSMNPKLGFFSYADLASVAIHEIGHCFGLEHSRNKDDVMYFAYSPEQTSIESFNRFVYQINYARLRNVP